MDIRRQELPLSLLMGSYFFLTITTFWILKPLKKGLFGEFYDKTGFNLLSWHLEAAQAELLAKLLNMVVAFLAVVVFTWLVRRFRRQQLSYILCGFFLISLAGFSLIINTAGQFTVWSYYLFGDLFATLMVAAFFAFLNDSVTPEAAKRLYGVIVFGGVLGGAFGTMVLKIWIESLSIAGWLGVCMCLVTLIAIIAKAAGREVAKNPPPETVERVKPEPVKSTQNPALEGAKLVLRSRYLMAIVGIVGLYEIASTILDFQFTSTILHYLDGPDISRQFATVYAITNLVAMFVQLFVTGLVMTKLGVKTALLILPFAILLGSVGFLILPVLWMGSFLNTIDNSFSYSINQSAKEALYVPTSRDEKYKAKAFIDMFVQRFAKALAVGVSLLITMIFADFSSKRWLSLFTGVVVILWVIAARYAGRKFNEITAES